MRYLVLVLLAWSIALPAQAYIDPGTGMMAIQGLIALVIGIVAFVKHPVQTARRWLRRLRGRRDDDA